MGHGMCGSDTKVYNSLFFRVSAHTQSLRNPTVAKRFLFSSGVRNGVRRSRRFAVRGKGDGRLRRSGTDFPGSPRNLRFFILQLRAVPSPGIRLPGTFGRTSDHLIMQLYYSHLQKGSCPCNLCALPVKDDFRNQRIPLRKNIIHTDDISQPDTRVQASPISHENRKRINGSAASAILVINLCFI